jgi:sulfate adenylyltransferase
MIAPHGGRLINRLNAQDQVEELLNRPAKVPEIKLDFSALNDLEMLATGAFSPLSGFLNRNDYRSVLEDMHMAGGTLWSLPVTLAVGESARTQLRHKDSALLTDEHGRIAGLIRIEDIYQPDKLTEAKKVYGTEDPAHPGVGRLFRQGAYYIGGEIQMCSGVRPERFAKHRLSPADTRMAFKKRGWNSVVAFQTRNPIHRAHEYIQKCALEITDGLLIHPLVGETAADDIPAEIRMKSYEILIRHYFPQDRVMLSVFPAAMRYAGPREAVFHALVRKNYGCTHFIVGRDHAGYRDYYGTYDAQKIFSRFSAEAIGITPLFFEHTFYCSQCRGMASAKTCPHAQEQHIQLSGTRVREILAAGGELPEEVSRPEVAEVLKYSRQ